VQYFFDNPTSYLQVVDELQVINRYCTTLMFALVDDALVFCPTVKVRPQGTQTKYFTKLLIWKGAWFKNIAFVIVIAF
jgi:hypothetical protein